MIDWGHWHNEPYLVGGLVVLGWLYALLVGPWRARLFPGHPFPRRHAAWFATSLVIFYLAVGSPLDQIGEKFLLTAHMVQHMALIYGAAVTFWWGLPPWLVAPLAAGPWRLRFWRVLGHPLTAGALYTLTLSVWHVPDLYDLALRDKLVHVVEHLMFFGAALIYWLPILSPLPAVPPRRPAVQMLYLLGVTIAMTPLFAFIAFSDNILYPTYEYAPRLLPRMSPMEDQLLGAATMKMGGLMMTALVLGLAFYRWYQDDLRRTGEAPRHA